MSMQTANGINKQHERARSSSNSSISAWGDGNNEILGQEIDVASNCDPPFHNGGGTEHPAINSGNKDRKSSKERMSSRNERSHSHNLEGSYGDERHEMGTLTGTQGGQSPVSKQGHALSGHSSPHRGGSVVVNPPTLVIKNVEMELSASHHIPRKEKQERKGCLNHHKTTLPSINRDGERHSPISLPVARILLSNEDEHDGLMVDKSYLSTYSDTVVTKKYPPGRRWGFDNEKYLRARLERSIDRRFNINRKLNMRHSQSSMILDKLPPIQMRALRSIVLETHFSRMNSSVNNEYEMEEERRQLQCLDISKIQSRYNFSSLPSMA